MKGNLRDFGPTQILNLVSLAEKTGTLSISRKGDKADLSFKDGKLIFASMNETDGSLVSILEAAGRINAKQSASLASHAKKHGDKQLGLLLIQKGYISRSDIVKYIKRHALKSINEFAKWQEGNFAFEQGSLPSSDRILVPLDLENVIIQIVQMQKRDKDLEEEIPSLDVCLKFTDRSKMEKPDLKLSKDQWNILRLVKPENTIRMIANALKMDDRQIRRHVGSLREAGLIELVAPQRPRENLSQEDRTKKRALVGRLIAHLQGI